MVTVQKDDVGKNGATFQIIMKFDKPVTEKDIAVEYPTTKDSYLKVFRYDQRLYRLKLYGDIDASKSKQKISRDGKRLDIQMPKLTNINQKWTSPGRCSPSHSSSDSS